MVLRVLESSSKGNCYILEAASGDTLILEAGINIADVKKALCFRLDKVSACLVTHQHRDHSKHLKDLLYCGIKVLALEDVFASHGIVNHVFGKSIKPMQGYKIGSFRVFALPVAHDVPCVGFVIEHSEMGKLLFVTDTMMLEYRVLHLNHIMIEANYCDEILQQNIDAGIVPRSMRERLLHSHMELQTTKDLLVHNDMSNVREVVLLHLSDTNSDKAVFCEQVQKATGKPVYIAEKGLELSLEI